jgi:superfamily II DNA/RNA helicase
VALLYKSLQKHGFAVGALHGDMDQSARTAALDQFRKGEIPLLVASDVAARGLDIPETSHVFNFDVPHHADDYVHRIGRTGRAGRPGTAISIVTPLKPVPAPKAASSPGRSIVRQPRPAAKPSSPATHVRAKAQEKAQDRDREKARVTVHRKPASRAGIADPDTPVAAAAPARNHRHRRLRSHRHPRLRPRAPLRSAAPKHRMPRARRQPSLPITRICRRSCCDPFAPESEPYKRQKPRSATARLEPVYRSFILVR